jgi:hypothetical protein
MSESPEEYRGMHRVLMAISAFFFVYLVVEGVFLVPWLLIRYGSN